MKKPTTNDSDYNFSESVKTENNSINCKDGYCFIPNLENNKKIKNENVNIFDPI